LLHYAAMSRTTKLVICASTLSLLNGCGGEEDEEESVAESALLSLPNSNFEIDVDANLRLDTAGLIDWVTVAESRRTDLPTGTSDNSFGQGSKEDTPVPSVVAGSIPPNKSDLLHFGVYLETTASDKFLHLFWHRVQEPSGTTNMDFEFNQSSTTSGNGVTPLRTAGDLLIQYDLSQGGVNPQLFVSKWLTSGNAATVCEASNTLPCWGKRVDLTAAPPPGETKKATGSINSSVIPPGDSDGLAVDLDGNGSVDPVSARTFGEASINFSALVGSGQCVSFGSAYLKSRSSDSFTAALKDFIAPEAVNISNCGGVTIIKKDDLDASLAGAGFTLYKDAAPEGGSVPGAEDSVSAGACTTAANGTCTITNVVQGPYWLVETTTPSGYDTAAPQSVIVVADSTVEKTFVDPRQRGAILVTKTRKHLADGPGDHPHAGVEFTVNGVKKTTDSNGLACFDNLTFGSYTVTETVPSGYAGEAPKSATVDNKASCSDLVFAGENVGFKNTPLSTLAVTFTSQISGGTGAQISCTGLTEDLTDVTPNAFDDVTETFKDLAPGTYTCTVVVDP
jgi:hypothetical protein